MFLCKNCRLQLINCLGGAILCNLFTQSFARARALVPGRLGLGFGFRIRFAFDSIGFGWDLIWPGFDSLWTGTRFGFGWDYFETIRFLHNFWSGNSFEAAVRAPGDTPTDPGTSSALNRLYQTASGPPGRPIFGHVTNWQQIIEKYILGLKSLRISSWVPEGQLTQGNPEYQRNDFSSAKNCRFKSCVRIAVCY